MNIEKYRWLIPIRLYWSWLIGFIVISLAISLNYDWTTSILLTISAYGTVLLHELTHVFVSNGISNTRVVNEIQLHFYGAIGAIDEKQYIDPGTEFLYTIAGPIMSLMFSIIFTIMGNRVDDQALIWLAQFNFFVFLYNCLPAYPLDGGRAIKAYLRTIRSNKSKGSIVADYRATAQALKLGEKTRGLLVALGIAWYYFYPQAINSIILLELFVVISWLFSLLEKKGLEERISTSNEIDPGEREILKNYLKNRQPSFSL